MTRHRRAVAIASLVAACVLTGCGGDDGDDQEQTRVGEPEEQTDCQAEVEVTGAKKASWSGPGYVITGGDLGVLYKTSKGKRSLTVYPAGKETPASAVFSSGKHTYTTQGEGTLEVDPDGGGAEVDSRASATDPQKKVKIVASIEC